MLILGGVGNIYGGLVGGALYMVLRQLAATFNPYHWMFAIGLLLIGVVLLGQNGVLGIVERTIALLRRAPASNDAGGAPRSRS
jgi:branched-chain amino acid transport system permease protein